MNWQLTQWKDQVILELTRLKLAFEKYIALHTEQHNIINSLKEMPEGSIDGLAKVQLIYDGILDPKLEPVKSQLFANEENTNVNLRIPLRCANKWWMPTLQVKKRSIQVSAVAQQKPYHPPKNASQPSNNNGKQHKKGKEKNKKGGKRGSRSSRKIDADEVEDRYYPNVEFNLFTPETK